MNSRDKILDISVAVLLLLCLFWAGGICLYFFFSPISSENAKLLVEKLSPSPLLDVMALITCLILILWLIFGKGAESRLWNWLPPFVFFRQFGSTGRKVLVVLLILGTLFGMLGEFLGFPAAF